MDDVGLEVSAPDVLARLYRGDDGVAVPVWNTGSNPVALDLRVDLDAVGVGRRPKAIAVADVGGVVAVKVSLPAHGLDVVVLEPASP
jgi:hypothetical protein